MAEYVNYEGMLAAFEKYYYDNIDKRADNETTAACVGIWNMLKELPTINIEQTDERG